MKLTIDKNEFRIQSAVQLRATLEANDRKFLEISLNVDPEDPSDRAGWPTICALINEQHAWLMFLPEEGAAGFSTRNPSHAANADASEEGDDEELLGMFEDDDEETIEYLLSNGQVDEYPAAWDVGKVEALKALEYFFANQGMAPWLVWNED